MKITLEADAYRMPSGEYEFILGLSVENRFGAITLLRETHPIDEGLSQVESLEEWAAEKLRGLFKKHERGEL